MQRRKGGRSNTAAIYRRERAACSPPVPLTARSARRRPVQPPRANDNRHALCMPWRRSPDVELNLELEVTLQPLSPKCENGGNPLSGT